MKGGGVEDGLCIKTHASYSAAAQPTDEKRAEVYHAQLGISKKKQFLHFLGARGPSGGSQCADVMLRPMIPWLFRALALE